MRLLLSLATLLSLFATAVEASALEESSIADSPEIALAAGELALEVTNGGDIDPSKCPDKFEGDIRNPWYNPKLRKRVPKTWRVKLTKVPCPGEGSGVCYMVDFYEPCGLFRLGLCYKGSLIIRIDSVDGLPGFYVYAPDGRYLWGYWFEGNMLCSTWDGGVTTECIHKSCFQNSPDHRNPFKELEKLRSPLLPGMNLPGTGGDGANSSSAVGELCPDYTRFFADGAVGAEQLGMGQ